MRKNLERASIGLKPIVAELWGAWSYYWFWRITKPELGSEGSPLFDCQQTAKQDLLRTLRKVRRTRQPLVYRLNGRVRPSRELTDTTNSGGGYDPKT